MAEIEPSKIWAATGVLVVTIVGVARAQIRSTGSSLAEAAAFAGSASVPALAQADYVPPSSNTTIYEAGYVGRAFGYIPAGFRSNPLALPVTSVESTLFRSNAEESADGDDQPETVSDVSQDLASPEVAQTDVPDIALAALDEQPTSEFNTAGNVTEVVRQVIREAGIDQAGTDLTDLYVSLDDNVNGTTFPLANGVVGTLSRLYLSGADGMNDVATIGQAVNADYSSTGFILNGNVHITFDPTTGQPSYTSNTLARNMNPVQSQGLAIQQALLQATPQGQALMAQQQAMFEQQAALAQQRGLGDIIAQQESLDAQQAQAAYLDQIRVQIESKVRVETEETIPLIYTLDESRSQYYYW